MDAIPALLCALGLAPGGAIPFDGPFDDHVFAVTGNLQQSGSAWIGIDDPWPSAEGGPTGTQAIVRHFDGRHYVVDKDSGDVQVIDAGTRETLATFFVGQTPHDILVLGRDRAYVTRYDSAFLYEVDPRTGVGHDAVDLSIFADADGLPEMSMLARDGSRAFVQIQRLDRRDRWIVPVAPSYLAVVDVGTNTLVDADPLKPGVQAIELQGPIPSFKMTVEAEHRRLYVSTPGEFLDGIGGIEEIDLDALRSLGFVTSEQQLVAAMGSFVMVSPEKGYVLMHTDLLPSTHLTAFSRIDGSHQGEHHVTFTVVESLDFDRETGQLFFPDPEANGVHVFDAATGARLTQTAIPTGLQPWDLVIARSGPALRYREGLRRATAGH